MARILVVDDDELFVKLMVHALRERGHEVEFAHDGEAGEHAFDAQPFDAVVCDLMMPRQEGLETIRYMRRIAPKLAIVAISSGLERQAGVDILDMAKRLGAHETVRKPFKLSQLTAAVETALASTS
jgi:DNA-binding response OmpR family regulator